MRIILRDKHEIHWFSSMNDVALMELSSEQKRDYMRRAMFEWAFKTNRKHRSMLWYGVKGGVGGVKKTIIKGWPEGVDVCRRLMDELSVPELPSFKRVHSWGRNGHTLNPIRAFNGSTNPWRTTKKEASDRTAKRGGSFTIFIDFMSNANRSARQTIWRAVVGLRMAEGLLKSGRRVRIIGVGSTSHKEEGSYSFAVTLKDYQQPFDLSACIVPVGLAGFLRVYEFASNATIKSFEPMSNYGIGIMTDLEKHLEPLLDSSIPILVDNIWDKTTAIQTLKNLTKKI